MLTSYTKENITKQTMTQQRNYQMDILRVLACLLVMWQHASENYYIGPPPDFLPVREYSTYIVGFLSSADRCAVALFVMISGYFLLPMRGTAREFFHKRSVRLVLPFIVWSVAYAVYFMFSRGDSLQQCLTNIAHIPVNFGTDIGHMWYVYMLIGLYLLVPVISPWLQSASKRILQFYLCIWLITSLLPYIHLLFPSVWGECYWNPTPMLYYFTGFGGFFVLGFYFRKFGCPSRLVSALLFIVGWLVTVFVFNSRIQTAESIPSLELSWNECSGNVALMAVGIFGFVNSFHVEGKGFFGNLLTDIAKKGYAIYLAHVIVETELAKVMVGSFHSVIIEIPIIAISSYILTYIMIKLMSYLPKAKYWLG